MDFVLHSREQLIHLIEGFTRMPAETEWVEFKTGNDDPEMVGKSISAMANTAKLHDQSYGYVIWGIRDEDRQVVGTTIDPESRKKGNQELKIWLATMIDPEVFYEFQTVTLGGFRLVLLTVTAASFQPIKFHGAAYVRIGPNTTSLGSHPDHERRLWRAFDRQPFETGTARDRLKEEDVLRLLDYPAYFDLLDLPLPENRHGILDALLADELIARMPGSGFRITNLGAILIAKNIDAFPALARKALRVIQYRGNNRVETVKEQVGAKGYAAGFEGLLNYINELLPANEVIAQALRTTNPVYPVVAIRELVANALIHQDFSVSGAGPMIEIFEDRIEVSNPGTPLVDAARFVDAPPRSRNEKLAALMRRMRICEERGSGWDRVAFEIEAYQLPAPDVNSSAESTRITVLSPRPLTQMTAEDKVRAVYLHACLRYVSRQITTNSSIRKRFKIPEHNKATASRLLGDAVKKKVIQPYDPSAPARLMRYVPFWATTEESSVGFVDA